MRSKAPLALMEQLVMVLVFALAAALCVQVFVLSDKTSRLHQARDRAMIEAQNAAEALKGRRETAYLDGLGGSPNGDQGLFLAYDEDWTPLDTGADQSTYQEDAAYYLFSYENQAQSTDYLWAADVLVFAADGDLLASLPVAGQREGGERHG